MKSVDEVYRQLEVGEYTLSRHALKRVVERNIRELEIQQAGAAAQVVEEYPTDKYAPSVLLLGFTENGRSLHMQVSLVESSKVKIITLYQPDESRWHPGFLKRR